MIPFKEYKNKNAMRKIYAPAQLRYAFYNGACQAQHGCRIHLLLVANAK